MVQHNPIQYEQKVVEVPGDNSQEEPVLITDSFFVTEVLPEQSNIFKKIPILRYMIEVFIGRF